MTQEDKALIEEFCNKNLKTHTDWTGTRVETDFKCESVGEFINLLFSYIRDNQCKL